MEDRIKLYSSPTCPKCKLLKMELGKRNIPFEIVEDTNTMNALGIHSLPILEINGELMNMPTALKWIKEQ